MKTGCKLPPKQVKFVEEYLIDLNGTQAVIRAGFSEKTARVTASKLLAKANIQEALVLRRQEIQDQLDVTPEKVVAEYAKLAFASMGTYATWGPNGIDMKDSDKLPTDSLAAVAEVTETRGEKTTTVRFKLHDKKGALDSLGKHLGMFIDKHELTGKDGGPIAVTTLADIAKQVSDASS